MVFYGVLRYCDVLWCKRNGVAIDEMWCGVMVRGMVWRGMDGATGYNYGMVL